MQLIEFSPENAKPIELFESVNISSVSLGDGRGEAHVYCLHFGPGSEVGEHPTDFGQLFLVIQGEGWASGRAGQRIPLTAGQGVYFDRGEIHAKGSQTGMVAIMIQVKELEPIREPV